MKHDLVRILLVDDDEDDYLLVSELFGDIHHIRFKLDWAMDEATFRGVIRHLRRAQVLTFSDKPS